jgi:thiamine biosynthesis lipoprotein
VLEPKLETRLHFLGRSCHILLCGGTADGQDLLTLAREEFDRLEAKFAAHQPDSLIHNINQCAGTGVPTPLDAESRSLFSYVTALWDQSNHLFDPTTRVLHHCYNQQGKLLATPQQLQGMLELVGWSGLQLDSRGALLPVKGMVINLDSCIRPYAVDSVRKLLLRNNVAHALIEMDQDVASIGRQQDGSNWLVGLRYPHGQRTAITRLKLNDKGFAIRGNFERRVCLGGENFGRALSPVDAQPLPGLLSVAVIGESCLTACSAANVARLKTEQAGLKWLQKLGLPWMAIDRNLNCHGPLAPTA